MKTKSIAGLLLILFGMSVVEMAMSEEETSFAPDVVSKTGAIRVPLDYSRWATLGTWAHADTEVDQNKIVKPGSKEYHVVYTQPETIDYYREHGRFPDGAVLVK